MGAFKGKAPAPPYGKSSNAGIAECHDNGWCFDCGGVGYLGFTFGGTKGQGKCQGCRGSGKAKGVR